MSRDIKLELITYYPTGWKLDRSKIKVNFPDWIREKLIYKRGRENDDSIVISRFDHEAIKFLDKTLDVKRRHFIKSFSIEISENHINEYNFFHVLPRQLNESKEINVETTHLSCEKRCQIGAQIIPPIKMLKNIEGAFFATYIFYDPDITLLISEHLQRVFAQNDIKGLIYHEECVNNFNQERLFRVTIEKEICHYADEIISHDLCQHDVLLSTDYVNCFFKEDDLQGYDFGIIKKVIVHKFLGDKIYYYRRPVWVISKRLLDLLLKQPPNLIKLQKYTYFTEQKFFPAITSKTISYFL